MAENIDNEKKSKRRSRGRSRGAGRTGDANDNFGKPSKKVILGFAVIIITAVVVFSVFGDKLPDIGVGGGVEFTPLTEEEIPKKIETEVVPEYRELERALGCLVDGKVYVVVMRGEKPTAGYDLAIEKMKLEKTDKGQNLIVTASFIEPPEDKAVSEIITYPYAVAVTELKELPDSIELNVRYQE